ncbi:hypothetical protein AB0C98_09960 [Streptomyces sp. NPDC048558]|uniref:hypothetical protein n=1 Tax=Streptomyces sp. NPDC048558 TaxID=3155759 RepID=UPI0033C1A350
MLQALHGDIDAGVVEVLRLADGRVEHLRLGEMGGRRACRGDQRDGHRAGPADDIGELPGHVGVQRRRAQQQVRLVPGLGHLMCFQQPLGQLGQIAQRVLGLPHGGDPRGGQQLR